MNRGGQCGVPVDDALHAAHQAHAHHTPAARARRGAATGRGEVVLVGQAGAAPRAVCVVIVEERTGSEDGWSNDGERPPTSYRRRRWGPCRDARGRTRAARRTCDTVALHSCDASFIRFVKGGLVVYWLVLKS